jgi:predicted anti-sigma-YlaC factor YlaD
VNVPERNARLALYVVAFLVMLAAGFTLVLSVRGLFASSRLLWLSAGMSVAAIIAALASILWRARSRPGPQGDRSG